MLDKDQINKIVRELIKSKALSVGRYSNFYENVERLAERFEFELQDEDYLKVQDEIWKLVLEGMLAPGRNTMNPWFPHCHLTKEGEEYRETLLQEEDK